MPLKLKRFNEGIWFDYPAGGRFKIRPLQPKDYFDLREQSKAGKLVVSKPDGQPEYVDNYNEALFFWKVFQRILEDWADIEVEGATTKDEVKETIFNNHALRDFISDRSNELSAKTNIDFEEELKNSASSQSGSHQRDLKNAQIAGKSTAK
jgi:hypothetical protein